MAESNVYAPPRSLRESPLEGIGGWLLLLAFQHVAGSLALVAMLLAALAEMPELILMTSVLLAVQLSLTVAFFCKNPVWPTFFIAINLIGIAIDVLELAASPLVAAEDVGSFIGGTIASLAWVAYVTKSKRVANTFREGGGED